MGENVREVAERIRTLREIEEVAEQDMADVCGLSLEEYRSLERGENDFSIGQLFSIAGKLDVDVMVLINGESPHLNSVSLVRQGEGFKVKRHSAYEYRHLAYTFKNKKVEPFMVTVEPNGDDSMPELNTHDGQEFDYIVEGILCMKINEHSYILNTGDSIYFDSKNPHALKAVGDKPTKLLAIVMK